MLSLEAQSPPPPGNKKSYFRELATVIVASWLLVAAFSIAPRIVPAAGSFSSLLIAVTFIYLPAFALWRRRETLDSVGLSVRIPWKGVGVALVVAGVVFPLFSVGFSFYQRTVYDREVAPGLSRLWDWGPDLRVDSLSQEMLPTGLVAARLSPRELTLLNNTPHPLPLQFQSTGGEVLWFRGVVTKDGGRSRVPAIPKKKWTVAPGAYIALEIQSPPDTIFLKSTVPIQVGRSGDVLEKPDGLKPGLSWILWMLLIHLVLIAFPEELFYRGYVQTRLQELWPARWSFLGGKWGWAVIVTSVIFALGHLVTIPNPARLAVFFPSLLFGWVRNRTDSIYPAVVLHALANVFQAMLYQMV